MASIGSPGCFRTTGSGSAVPMAEIDARRAYARRSGADIGWGEHGDLKPRGSALASVWCWDVDKRSPRLRVVKTLRFGPRSCWCTTARRPKLDSLESQHHRNHVASTHPCAPGTRGRQGRRGRGPSSRNRGGVSAVGSVGQPTEQVVQYNVYSGIVCIQYNVL